MRLEEFKIYFSHIKSVKSNDVNRDTADRLDANINI